MENYNYNYVAVNKNNFNEGIIPKKIIEIYLGNRVVNTESNITTKLLDDKENKYNCCLTCSIM